MADQRTVKLNNFTWGLNLQQPTTIADSDFTIAKNVFYNKSRQLQTRRWYVKFWDPIGSSPITSYYFMKRDDTQERIAVCNSGTVFYKYNENTWAFDSVQTWLTEYETLPWRTSRRTRRDYTRYKNVIYMGNGVDPYASYDWSTYTKIGVSAGVNLDSVDHTADTLTKTAHGLANWDELYITTGWAMPAGITSGQVYYVVNKTNDTFQISTARNGTAVAFTSNGTGTHTYYKLTKPRCRYMQYLGDRLYGAWDDANPTTLYYSAAAPADGTTISANAVVIAWDENGIINWLNEYNKLVLVFKDKKIYGVDVANSNVDAVDTQSWWYADRTIQFVGNELTYFNERGIDTLSKKYGIEGVWGIAGTPLSAKVQALTDRIEPRQYNSWAAIFARELNNYYFAFDTNDDNRPDKVLVYNADVNARTEYVYPALYDFGEYVDGDGEQYYLFASATWGQMYRMEHGFNDNWADIEALLRSKSFDFGDPVQFKEFFFVDIVGRKQLWAWDITVRIYIDEWEFEFTGTISDDQLQMNSWSHALWVDAIWVDTIWASSYDSSDDLTLYRYEVRIPFYARGSTLSFELESSGVQWIFEKARIWAGTETVDVLPIGNII